jgi:hypothetical protein
MRVEQNTNEYLNIFSSIADRLIPEKELDYLSSDSSHSYNEDPLQGERRVRLLHLTTGRTEEGAPIYNTNTITEDGIVQNNLNPQQNPKGIPPELTRNFSLQFISRKAMKYVPMRKINADYIGNYVMV